MSYKVIPPKHAFDVTFSLEEGLLLNANPLSKYIVLSAMARAQFLHPVTICHYLTEATHCHFMLVVDNPDDVAGFVGRFKTETAHYLNSMLGKDKRTVWCEDYLAIPILTVSSAIKKISYIYTNPAKDNLETTIENYPGLSSWEAWRSGRHHKTCPRVHRPMIPYLPGKFYSKNTYIRHMRDLKRRAKSSHVLTIKPDAWMETFQISSEAEKRSINEEALELIREEERHYQAVRKAEGKTVIGREALAAAHLDLDYIPRRKGKKMWCICDDKNLRTKYITWAKDLKQKAREVYERWKVGDYSISFPPGIFPPAVPKRANMTALATAF